MCVNRKGAKGRGYMQWQCNIPWQVTVRGCEAPVSRRQDAAPLAAGARQRAGHRPELGGVNTAGTRAPMVLLLVLLFLSILVIS